MVLFLTGLEEGRIAVEEVSVGAPVALQAASTTTSQRSPSIVHFFRQVEPSSASGSLYAPSGGT
jgi:hypothetical protein